MADTLTSGTAGAPLTGSYSASINGSTYHFETADLALPGSIEKFYGLNNTFVGAASFADPHTLKVTITAYNGIPVPAQNVAFTGDFGSGSKSWAVVSLNVKSATRAARKYDAEIHQLPA